MRKILPLAIVTSLLLVGAGCLFGGGTPTPPLKPITLQYWRTQDDQNVLDTQIAAYKKIHPNVNVVVKKLREEDYERTLLEAFAQNKGPDIFSIPNVWISSWKANLLPMPKETTVVTQEVNAQQKIVTVSKKAATMSILDFSNRFVEGVVDELIIPFVEKEGAAPVSKIYGLPLSADSLGMFYNRDILKRGNIEQAPRTWADLQEAATKLTVFDSTVPANPNPDAPQPPRIIKQSGAAIGLGKNVQYVTDIMAALMAQNGARLTDESGYAQFSSFTPETQGQLYPPGSEALIFYQSFALPDSANYSWDATMPQSLDAFISGKAAFYFGLPSDLAKIRERAPRLDVGTAPLPQVDLSRPYNILHYPVEVVSRKTTAPNEAWDFLQFVTSADQAGPFVQATKRPTALRSLIEQQLSDAEIAPFAGQALTARSWYRGNKYSKVEEAFATMVETYPTYEKPEYNPIVGTAASAVNDTMLFR